MADSAAELKQAASLAAAAQAEAIAQEEVAELAKGELAEYQRRMAAEVSHARREALKSVDCQPGGTAYFSQAGRLVNRVPSGNPFHAIRCSWQAKAVRAGLLLMSLL